MDVVAGRDGDDDDEPQRLAEEEGGDVLLLRNRGSGGGKDDEEGERRAFHSSSLPGVIAGLDPATIFVSKTGGCAGPSARTASDPHAAEASAPVYCGGSTCCVRLRDRCRSFVCDD